MVIRIALSKAYTVSRLRACDDDLLDAELASTVDHIVRRQNICLEAFVVWYKHVPCPSSEVNDNVRCGRDVSLHISSHVEVLSHRVEDLPSIGEVSLEREDVWVVEWYEVEVQDFVAAFEEVGNDMTAGLARPTSEYNALASCGCRCRCHCSIKSL